MAPSGTGSASPPTVSSGSAVEIRLPVELIIAEARRCGVADEVGLRVLPTGRVHVLWSTRRGGEFVERLTALEARDNRRAP
jgi:hypothetical protein